MRPWRRIREVWTGSIRRRLMLGIATLHAVLMSVFVLDLVERQRAFLHRQSVEQARSLAESLAANATSWVLADDVIGLEEVIGSQSRYPGLRYAMVLDPRGRVLGHGRPARTGLYVSDPVSLSLLGAAPTPHTLVDDRALVDVAAPVLANGQLVGWARVAVSQEAITAQLRAVVREGLLYTLAAIALGTLFAYLMARGLTHALHELVHVANETRRGRRDLRAAVDRRDEVGDLGRDVNAMLEAIADSENALEAERDKVQVTLASIGDGVIATDLGGRVEYLNPVASALTGWPAEEARGHPLGEVFHCVDEGSGARLPDPVAACLALGAPVSSRGEAALVHRGGRRVALEHTAAPIHAGDGALSGAVLVFRDVTEARRLAHELTHQATHDALTGLVNRRELERRLIEALERARSDHSEHCLAYLDLDQFKLVNDTCGHVAGDALLRRLAHALAGQLRAHDTLARLGGDEFGLLLEYCPLEQATRVVGKLLEGIAELRFAWDDKVFSVAASVGLVAITRDVESITAVLSAADNACYVAKERGRNRIHVHRTDDRAVLERRGEMEWVARLHEALASDQLALYAQRIVPLRPEPGLLNHHEVLLRLHEGDGRVIPPGAFIPAAERYNLMPAVDRWVVSHFLRWLEAHPEAAREGMLWAVNLSGPSLGEEDFLGFLLERLAAVAVPPQRLCFEITETAAITNLGQATRLIRTLREHGCHFALDDFGSGMSSFAYLKTLSVDFLKIDGRFVRDMVHDPTDRAMVEAIHRIGHVMGLRTIAELVEDADTLTALRAVGVDYAQGYGIDRPSPLPDG